MIEKPYKAMTQDDGKSYVSGPGVINGLLKETLNDLPMYETIKDAKMSAEQANTAYKIGYKHAQADMRNALGIKV